jgi:nitrous oxidase accessory protein
VAASEQGRVSVIAAAALFMTLQSGQITVGPAGDFHTITDALDMARTGDTVRVAAGVYEEHPVITQPVVLIGERGAVIDGAGAGVVLSIQAKALVSGFTIRSSGARQSDEHSGILAARADSLVIENNQFEDVLFGIYIKQSNFAVIRGNKIACKEVAIPLRGDGIRLWYSHGGLVEDNSVSKCRDLVIWFSNNTEVQGNAVSESRYGLHYMYSNHNRFEHNEFVSNEVGAFLMYSTDVVFRDNVFADATGPMGRGLGFKDTDSVVAVGNTLVRNTIGIFIDNSPQSVGVHNLFSDNLIAFNEVAVSLLPSVKSNIFERNTFLHNLTPVTVTGGGTAVANRWLDNYWSSYAGFDVDNDDHGDSPFVYERLSNDLLAKHEELKLFDLGPAAASLNTLSRVLPLLQPIPIVIDSAPRLSPVHHLDGRQEQPKHPLIAAGFSVVAVCAAALALRSRTPFRSRS